MKTLVRVVAVDADHVWVALAKDASGCGGCAGICSLLFARAKRGIRLPVTVLATAVNENDLLVIDVGSDALLQTTALACGLPVVGLLLSAGLADALGGPAWTPPAVGLLGLVMGSVIAAAAISRGKALQLRARSTRVSG